MRLDFGGEEDILFERIGKAGVVTLNRPRALNALNHRMVNALSRALQEWEADSKVALVIVKGEGRAFSAGGDILDVYRAGMEGKASPQFFADEYRLNAAIARFPKPYVALIDGIVMGGGVGISFHGSHRIMTENAVFAMPEVGIGFFPDVGGSFLLANLPRSFGMYLGLTGNRIKRGDALWSGLATHVVDAELLPELLGELTVTGNIRAALRSRTVQAPREIDEAAVHAISHHFSCDTLEAIFASLREAANDGDEFARATLETMLKRSPTSMHVAFRQISTGGMLSMDECMRMEYRILNRMLTGHDFYEGIRAALIDKGSTPQWKPARLEDVDPADIEAYFAPLPNGELEL
ncbi:enoyl-CoA hydratase/carnithine racemase [Mesorhizobium sp. J18]|nr:enoyl-CoA hydratase/carnithine racemase [Mesorhizobium sp. J18]